MHPEAVLSQLTEQVAAAAAAATPLRIRGGDTRAFYGEPWATDTPAKILDVAAYQGVVNYQPSELVITARAGTPLVTIEDLLAANGQMLAFEPARFGPGDTLGGCVACGLSGPRRLAAGPLSDYVLGTRLLTAAGDVLRLGGEVMKNVAGYDLSRLLAGSLGILGVLLEVSLKVVPRPAQEATCVLDVGAGAALEACLKWRSQPTPVSATAWLTDGNSGRLYVRLSGNQSAVHQGLQRIGGERLKDAEAAAFWTDLRDQKHAFFQQRPLWRVVLPPKVATLEVGPVLQEWGGTLRWLAGPQDAGRLRARVAALGGSVGLYRRGDVPMQVPAFHPLGKTIMQFHRRLKQEFDPAGIFNRGRLDRAF